MTNSTDVLIVGSGPAGMAMACSLAQSGHTLSLFDREEESVLADPLDDGREIALTHRSKLFLNEMGVWRHIPDDGIHPLYEAKVFSGAAPFSLHFENNSSSNLPLGFLISNFNIRRALYKRCKELEKIVIHSGQSVVSACTNNMGGSLSLEGGQKYYGKLLLAADNRFSSTRKMLGVSAKMQDFGRVMIVANVTHQDDHRHIALEWFKYGLTCATLPLQKNTSSLVLTVSASQSHYFLGLSDENYLRELEGVLEGRLGRLEAVASRQSYPLVGVYADQFVGEHFALIGDAAVGMHPVTAHGFNLGLQSVSCLLGEVQWAAKRGQDIGSARVLRQYQWKHSLRAKPLYEATNAVVKIFTDDRPLVKFIRSGALVIANYFPGFKKRVAHQLTQ